MLLVRIILWVPVPELRMVVHLLRWGRHMLRRQPAAHVRLRAHVWLIREEGPTWGPPSRRRRTRRPHGRNVAVGSPAADRRVRVPHRLPRGLRLPERHESVALRAAGLAIGDDDGLEDFAVLLKVVLQALGRRLPRQAADEHLGQRGVAEPRPVVRYPAAAAAAGTSRRRRVSRRCRPSGRRR